MNSLKLVTPSRHDVAHLFEDRLWGVGGDHVEGVVDAALPGGLLMPGVERLPQRAALLLDGEVDDGRGAAKRRRARTGQEVVAGSRAAKRHVEVGMGIDATWNDVTACGIDDSDVAPRGDGLAGMAVTYDLVAVDPQVCLIGVARRDEGAVLDDRDHTDLRVAGTVAQTRAT
jgi:hypothetical protein